jgi:CPA1 family monovalent cation:H+ antiporter
MGDALHLKFEDLRRYGMDIFYLAVVSVAISIAVGASLHHFDIFPELGLGAYVALFAINMATDAVSVQSILSRFEGIEHKIKVLIEGESLGNDATAVIAYFFVGIPWMMNGTMSAGEVFAVSLKVFILSIAIGLTVGYLFYLWMKILEEKRNEFFSFVIEAYSVYLIAEHFHLSGILSLITAIVSTKALIDIDLKRSAEGIYREGRFSFGLRRSKFLDISATTEERMEYIYEMAKEFGYIAAVIIFFMLAEVVDPHLLIKYWREIVIMFLATTVIRALSMAKFAFIGDRTEAIKPVGKEGWFVLTFSGMKGALSIILVHMLPQELPYRELFEAVTVGTVILSIFVYGSVLWFYFAFRPIGTDRV